MSERSYRNGGWTDKYVIFKRCPACAGQAHSCGECVHGLLPVESDAVYLVLRLDADLHARAAARACADSVEKENPQFAADIRHKLATTPEPAQ